VLFKPFSPADRWTRQNCTEPVTTGF